jgi:hypothetical protein
MTYNFVTKETQKSVTIIGGGGLVTELISYVSSADAQFLANTKIIAWWSFDTMADNKGHEPLLTGDTKLVP